MIDITEVSKRYGSVRALDGVSLTIEDGETVGLLGTNGAGKTTLFRLIVGHSIPDEGAITVAGMTPSAGTAVRRRVGYLPESAGFPHSFTGREVLEFHARIRDVPGSDRDVRVADVLSTVGLTAAADRAVGGYSNGMRRRLGLATALVGRPRVLLLDEPTAGLDPRGVDAFNEAIARLDSEMEITTVFSSHRLPEVEAVCERVVVLHDGRVRADGRVDELRRSAGESVVIRARLGRTDGFDRLRDRLPRDLRSLERLDDRRLRLVCPRSAAFDVLSTLHAATVVESFEVKEPGLEDAFRQAIDHADEGVSA